MSGPKALSVQSDEQSVNPFKVYGEDVHSDKDYFRVGANGDTAQARANGWDLEKKGIDVHDRVNASGEIRWMSRSKQRSEQVGREEVVRARERLANIGAVGIRGDAFSSCSSNTVKVFLPKAR